MDDKIVNPNSGDPLCQSVALNKIAVDLLEQSKKDKKVIVILFCVACLAFLLATGMIAYSSHQDKMALMNEMESTRIDFMEFMDSFEYETVETTQSVEGDGSDIVNGDQYNDSAVHNEEATE